ncbi:serine protease [Candidatus Nomurabacteria bacterium]|nr:serine protease [Candidatus Nomurabacteria bacterium]
MVIGSIIRNRRTAASTVAAVVVLLVLSLLLSSCSPAASKVFADDLMQGIEPAGVEGKVADQVFITQMADFAVKILKGSLDDAVNTMVSPLSVMLALSMTANGAVGQTLGEMETLLGGDIAITELNKYLYTYAKGLPSSDSAKLRIANSIWFRKDEGRFIAEKDFLQTNADYYMADAFKGDFDDQTLQDINNWVDDNTDGMIDKILDEIKDDTVMYLINAIVMDAKWETVYNKNNIFAADFHAANGSVQDAQLMQSEEYKYIKGSGATGFIKPYAGGTYSFAAILPDEENGLEKLVADLNGEGFLELLENATDDTVTAYLPKFTYDYKIKMNDMLKELGMKDAFDANRADLSKLGKSSRGNLYVGEVLHKTFISVDELGTKAGAVTKVEVNDESYTETKIVRLNRPFLYAIIDNATGLPVFLGTVISMAQEG